MRTLFLLTALAPTLALAQPAARPSHVGMMDAAGVSPIPGGCESPPPTDPEAVGCFLSASVDVAAQGEQTWWHIVEYATAAAARAEQPAGGVVTSAFGRTWLQVIGPESWRPKSGRVIKVVGPMKLRTGIPLTARFIQSTFTPGMRTRVHAHPGPEAFFMVSGAQCMDTTIGKAVAAKGEALVIPEGASMQLHSAGSDVRQTLAVVVGERGKPWMTMSDWEPTGACR